jgi:glycosyltransferase involved in cell wall biosynthesis
MISIGYLTNISTPYRKAMVETWSRILGPEFRMTVYYTDRGDQGRGWNTPPLEGVDEIRLSTIVSIPKYGRLNLGLLQLARAVDILIIGGFEQASYLVAAALARLCGKKVILMFDGFSPRRFDTETAPVRWIKRATAALCHAYFVNGKVGARYLKRIGAPPAPTFNQYLSASTREIDAVATSGADRDRLRQRHKLPLHVKLVAFCGYLVERKRPDLLIEALQLLEPFERPTLVFIGTGPLRAGLERMAEKVGVDARFVGFHDRAGLAQLYWAVDILVLPSNDDPWGLVVNEAMAANLPVIVSDACGCAEDLVVPGYNGFVFESGNAQDLQKYLRKALHSDASAMGRNSRSLIDEWTPLHSALSLKDCVARVRAGTSELRRT